MQKRMQAGYWTMALLILYCCEDEKPATYQPPVESDSGRVADTHVALQDADIEDSDAAGGDDASIDEKPYLDEQVSNEDRFRFDVSSIETFADNRSFSLAATNIAFALSSLGYDEEATCPIHIDTHVISSSDTVQEHRLELAEEGKSCPTPTGLAIVSKDTSWFLAWKDEKDESAELYGTTLENDDKPTIIQTSDRAQSNVALTEVDSRILMAWVEQITNENEEKRYSIWTKIIGDEAEDPIEIVAEEQERVPENLVIANINDTAAVLGWVDASEVNQGAYVLPLNKDGATDKEPGKLTAYKAYSMDIATGDNGHIAVYSISIDGTKQIRMQKLNGNGGLTDAKDERKLVTSPQKGGDASIVWWGGHEFLMAYRVYLDNNITEPTLRLMSIDLGRDWNQDSLTVRDVATTSTMGGQVSIERSNDGVLMLAWLNIVSVTQTELRGLRLTVGENLYAER